MKNAMCIGEAMAIMNRQSRHSRLEEDAVTGIDFENDADTDKVGLSKHVKDGIEDLDLDTGDFSMEISADADDDTQVSAIDITLYGNEDMIQKVFASLKRDFQDVVVKGDANESAGRTTRFHCFSPKKK